MTTATTRVLKNNWQDVNWQSETFFSDNDRYFDELIDSLNQARCSIILATYIFHFDAIGQRFVKSLTAARERGVTVRVLFDGIGSKEEGDVVAAALEEKDIPVKIFHPLPWQISNPRRSLRRGSWLGNVIFHLLRINQRHHAKYCIIDNEILWCGSPNVSMVHVSADKGGGNWHDIGVRLTGPQVQSVVDAFEDIWHFRRPRLGRGLFRYYWSNITERARREKNKLIAEYLSNARERIWIINPYFSPTTAIVRALMDASRNGADVRVIVSYKSDIEFFPQLMATYYEELLKHKVRIFEYQPAILHAKLLMIDDMSLIGSTNLNHRSLLHDVEFDVLVRSADAEQQFAKDQQQSKEITLTDLDTIKTRRLLGWIPWLVRYWL